MVQGVEIGVTTVYALCIYRLFETPTPQGVDSPPVRLSQKTRKSRRPRSLPKEHSTLSAPRHPSPLAAVTQ